MTFTGRGGVQAGHMVYVAKEVKEFFLSKEACRDLGVIEEEFPVVGAHLPDGGQVCGATRRRRSSSAPPP